MFVCPDLKLARTDKSINCVHLHFYPLKIHLTRLWRATLLISRAPLRDVITRIWRYMICDIFVCLSLKLARSGNDQSIVCSCSFINQKFIWPGCGMQLLNLKCTFKKITTLQTFDYSDEETWPTKIWWQNKYNDNCVHFYQSKIHLTVLRHATLLN